MQHQLRRRLMLETLEDRRLLAVSPGNLVSGSGLGSFGEVRVFDSVGEEQSRLAVPSQNRRGVPVAVGDVNRDGVPDIVAGSGFGGLAEVLVVSGTDNAELLRLMPYGPKSHRGVFVAAADVNGDGAADVITSPARGKDPTVIVFSGNDGSELYRFAAHQRPVSGGEVKVATGDIDGDGQTEIIAGVRSAGKSWVKLFQGDDGSLIGEFEVSQRGGSAGGLNVAAADLDGNGAAEIIVGVGQGNRSTLQIFDADGMKLHELNSDSAGPSGGVRLAAADVNQDGHDDIITGSGLGMRPQVEVFSGADFSKLSSFQPFDKNDRGGVFVAGVPSTSRSLSLAANLANDTGPNGPNDDGLTSDAGLSVSISNPNGNATNPTTLYVGIDDATPDQPASETESPQATILLDHATLQSLYGGPLGDGPHVVYLQARDTQGNQTDIVPVAFTLDTVPPQLADITPNSGFVSQTNFAVVGQATDTTSDVTVVRVEVDAGQSQNVPVDNAGQFQFDTNFPLDGTADDMHTVDFQAVDRAGNQSPATSVDYWLAAVGQLRGAPGDLANDHIPDVAFPPATAEEFSEAGGQSISRTTLAIMFADDATVSEVNSLLSDENVKVVAGEPAAGIVYAIIDDSADLDQMMAKFETLNSNVLIAAAAPNAVMVPRSLPPHHEDQLASGWSYATTPQGGNNGLELIRAPQMWNLQEYGDRGGSQAELGVIDKGYDVSHPDLDLQVPATTRIEEHGTHVAGIMGATWDNSLGTEGVAAHNPVIHARQYADGGAFDKASWIQDIQILFAGILATNPDVVGVNMSYAYPNYDLSVNPQTDNIAGRQVTFAQFTDTVGSMFNLTAEWFSDQDRSNFLIAAGVGYDARPGVVRAQDSSPMANAAVRYPNGHFLAVEAVNQDNAYDPDPETGIPINLGGSVSAPGYDIRSAGVGDDDQVGNPAYATLSGTSMATPFVTGLIGYLWHLDPTLTFDEVRALVTDPDYTVKTDAPLFRTAPRIDAFAATVGIDVLQGTHTIQKALVNVDDATADGNSRRDPFTEEVVIGFATPDGRRGDYDPLTPEQDTRITMRDFRAWRDAYLQIHESEFKQEGLYVSLDPDLPSHFKRDLNQNGCVAEQVRQTGAAIPATHGPVTATACNITPDENVFPRFDFNGDGVIGHWSATAPFKIDPDSPGIVANHNPVPAAFTEAAIAGFYRDIDVMADPDIWSATEMDGYSENVAIDPDMDGQSVGGDGPWNTWAYLLQQQDPPDAADVLKDLPDYIHSFDLHIDVDWQSIDPDYEEVLVQIESEQVGPDFAEVFQREVRLSRTTKLPIVATMPLWTGNVQVSYEGIDQDLPKPSPSDKGSLSGQVKRLSDLRLGEDRAILVRGSSLATLHTIYNPDQQNRGFPPSFLPTDIAVDSSGRTHFAYRHDVGGFSDTAALNVAYSDDGGETVVRQALVSGDGEFSRKPWFQKMTVGPSDEVYLTYATFLNSASAEIWFTYSLDRGDNFSTPQLLSSPDATGISDASPDVTVDVEGAVHVVWTQGEQLLMRTSSNQGQTFGGAELRVFDSNGPFQAQVEAGGARQEGEATDLHLSWLAPDGYGFPSLYYSRRQADGSWTSKAAIHNEVGTTFFRSYDLASSISGLAGALYVDPSDPSFVSDLYYQPILGGLLLNRQHVSRSPESYDHFGDPALRIDDTGAIWTAWHHEGDPMTVALSQDGGATFDEIFVGGDLSTGGVGLALDANQNALVTWSEGDRGQRDLLFKQIGLPASQSSSPQQQTSASLAAQTFDLESTADSKPFLIDESNLNTSTEALIFQRNETFAWEDATRREDEIPRSAWPRLAATTPANRGSLSPPIVDRQEAENRLADQVLAGFDVDLLDPFSAAESWLQMGRS